MRLAHLSDPHLGPLPPVHPWQLASKRLFGYLNWQRNRGRSLGSDVLGALIADLKSQGADHTAVTGDLVNIALPGEYVPAARFLASLGPPESVTVVPGNHDAYVPGGLAHAVAAWSPNLTSDAEWRGADMFPVVRIREPVALVGISTAVATAPLMATGQVGDRQLARLRDVLTEFGKRGLCRVVLIHHPVHENACAWYKRLVDAKSLRTVLMDVGAELVLHGHTHLATVNEITGLDATIPLVGVPCASQSIGGHRPAARYNLIDIESVSSGWRITLTERGFADASGQITTCGKQLLKA